MPALQTAIGHLNHAFSRQQIRQTVKKRRAWAAGKKLAAGVVMHSKTAVHQPWLEFLDTIPVSLQEAVRSVIHHALSQTPPVHITFAWAPSYDFEVSIWDSPDTRATRGGITILIKSRYPHDTHPLKAKGDNGAKGKNGSKGGKGAKR
jgi:hypothetical protein